MSQAPEPQKPPWHMPAPQPIGGASDFAPAACAAKVEYSCFKWSCPQEGHATPFDSALRRTSFSKRVPQSSQVYSKIGIPTSKLSETNEGNYFRFLKRKWSMEYQGGEERIYDRDNAKRILEECRRD